MAKGLRSSVKKANRTKLRDRVTRPVEDARTERLSAKLQELASQPKPSEEAKMDVEEIQSSSHPSKTEPTTTDETLEGWSPNLISMPVPSFLLRRSHDNEPPGVAAEEFFNILGLVGVESIRGFTADGSLLVAA
ncbi:MAG: major facilitator super transporter protein [Chaenotheca gracillima]|nr:MAG: major facilitator super transporter protein [Chaenotheca gracillima]